MVRVLAGWNVTPGGTLSPFGVTEQNVQRLFMDLGLEDSNREVHLIHNRSILQLVTPPHMTNLQEEI